MKLFVANLNYDRVDETVLRDLFEPFGVVVTAELVRETHTNKSRGFGFVDMATDEDATQAINHLNGTNLQGRKLFVQISNPKEKNHGR